MTEPLLFEAPVKRWSFSTLKQFEKCPYSVYLAKVEKEPGPPRDEKHPAERGDRIHKEAEHFVMGDGAITKDLKKIETQLTRNKEIYADGRGEVEQKWGFTKEWAITNWGQSDCWAMVKCDFVAHDGAVIHIDDYKTGKSFGNEIKHGQQMQIYAISGLMRYPEKQLVRTRLLYSDEGKEKVVTYTRPQVMEFLPRVSARALQLTNATAFPPKPNRANCKYCDFGVTNGTGACPYAVSE